MEGDERRLKRINERFPFQLRKKIGNNWDAARQCINKDSIAHLSYSKMVLLVIAV